MSGEWTMLLKEVVVADYSFCSDIRFDILRKENH
jgi:hypothetical protein